MRTQLIFNTEKLIKRINSSREFYKINKTSNMLDITKKYKNKRGRPFSISLLDEIKVYPETVGLIVGEGFISDRHFVFANSNDNATHLVRDFLKQFNLPIRIYLEISTKGKSKAFIKECVNFWEKCLSIKIKKIRLRKEFYNITNHGTIHMNVNNSLVAKLLKEIIFISKNKIEKNKQLSINYIKGVIAAEGNINIKKTTKCVYMIRISASKPKEREHYKRCLERMGIKIYCKDMPTISPEEGIKRSWKTTRGRAGAVIISRWDNFVKIFELDLLEIHKDKERKFIKYFVNNKFTQQFLDFGYFMNKKFTMKDAQIYFKFRGRKLDRVLTLYKSGYISRKKIDNKKFEYKLTKKYLSLYNKLNSTLNNPIYQ